MELEPLSEEAALEYIDPGQNSADARWLDWIVETAGLTELPLYLQITRQLSRRDRLDYLSAKWSAQVDMRSMDRSKLRLHLLTTWMEALFDGHLMGAVPLNRHERKAAVEWLSALAWQTIPRADLKRFWAQMAERARGVSTDHDLD